MSVASPDQPVDWSRFERNPRPFYGLPPSEWAVYRVSQQATLAVCKLGMRIRTQGRERVPRDGPMLLLGNHTSMLDPFYAAAPLHRPSRFMAATSVVELPVIGRWLRAVGAFPKMKFVKDRDSMETLAAHYDRGFAITLFPEGRRSWDGQLAPVGEGIGRLIKRLNARVVYAQLRSAYLVQPRWARFPRYVPLDITYDGPHTYDISRSAAELRDEVVRKLRLDPKRDTSLPAWGFRMAEGLENLLWQCPVCLAADTMTPRGPRRNTLGCTRCGADWRLDVDTVLHAQTAGAETTDVRWALAAQWQRLGDPPALDRDAYQADGTLGTAPDVRVLKVARGGKQHAFARGALRFSVDGLELLSGRGAPAWRVPMAELLAVSNDVANQVFVRRADGTRGGELFRLVPEGESPLKWGFLLQAWAERTRPIV